MLRRVETHNTGEKMATTMRTLIMADSRGARLMHALAAYEDMGDIRITVHKGAGFERVVTNSLSTLRAFKPHLIVLFSGICDLTKRDRRSRVTTMIHEDMRAAVNGVTTALDRALSILNNEGYYEISVATLTGIDLRAYNNLPIHPRDPVQSVLNSAVVAINREIIDTNKSSRVPSTWAASMVHAYYRGSYHHLYRRLADGCHPTQATNKYWARMMTKTIKLMKRLH